MEKKTNIVQIGILVILVVIAFLLGSLLEKKSSTTIPTDTTQNVDNTQQEVVPTVSNEEIAVSLGINKDEFNTCIVSAEITKKLEDQIASGAKSGVSGTPGNFLVDTQTGLAIELGGAVPLANLKSEFAKLKSGTGTKLVIDPITTDDYVRGDTKARYALIEWSDFDCPYCATFQITAIQFIEENKDVKWVYRQFPLDFHPNAKGKSIAALCAGKIGGNDMFWKYSDELIKQGE